MELKLAKMAFSMLLVWFLSWTPYAAVSIATIFFNGNGISPIVAVVPTICTKGSAFANAMLYGIRYFAILLLPEFSTKMISTGLLIVLVALLK